MKFVCTLLCLTLLLTALMEAVALHRATVCRQKAYLKSTELLTRATLKGTPENEQDFDLQCRLYLKRSLKLVIWKRLPTDSLHRFQLNLVGNL